MRILRLASLIIACSVLLACTTAATRPASVEERVTAQNSLFEEVYETGLKEHPERATAYGDYRYNDQLDDYSLAGLRGENAADTDFLARLKAISTAGFAEQDLLSHEVLQHTLEQHIRNYEFKEFETPVGTIKRRLHTARERLREQMERSERGELLAV